jgi:hypothetical protein
LDRFFSGNKKKAIFYILGSNTFKIISLATRQNRFWDFMNLSGCEDKLDMFWRFFKDLEKSVKSSF